MRHQGDIAGVATARSALPSTPGFLRSTAVLAACVIGTVRLGRAASEAATAASTGTIAPDAVVAAATLALGAVACGVLGIGALLLVGTALARLAGGSARGLERAAARLTPAVVRRAVAVTLTTGLGLAGTAGVASATEFDLGWEVTHDERAGSQLAEPAAEPTAEPAVPTTEPPVPVAEPTARAPEVPAVVEPPGDSRASSTTSAPAAVRTVSAPVPEASPEPTTATVTVARGDSLWAIAAEHLPDGATDAEIAGAWPRWYALNEQVIGEDPDLIRPGQQLLVPDGLTTEESR